MKPYQAKVNKLIAFTVPLFENIAKRAEEENRNVTNMIVELCRRGLGMPAEHLAPTEAEDAPFWSDEEMLEFFRRENNKTLTEAEASNRRLSAGWETDGRCVGQPQDGGTI